VRVIWPLLISNAHRPSITMGPPPIQVFLTTIASQPALRQRQEYLLRILQAKKIPFTSYDLASDEDAKRLWRRKAPASQSAEQNS
jgi:SH3 domain-binding glutamic acid-rich protein